jgi:hypothetical protein
MVEILEYAGESARIVQNLAATAGNIAAAPASKMAK